MFELFMKRGITTTEFLGNLGGKSWEMKKTSELIEPVNKETVQKPSKAPRPIPVLGAAFTSITPSVS